MRTHSTRSVTRALAGLLLLLGGCEWKVNAADDAFYPEPVFVCANRDGFLPLNHRCNRHVECKDGSDEQGCPSEFECLDPFQSINADWRCDGFKDCVDGSDEQGCVKIVPIGAASGN